MKYKILVFSWNTQSTPLYDSTNNMNSLSNLLGLNSSNLLGFTTKNYYPDFFENLKEKIEDQSPDVVVIGFQEDRQPGSYFHSHYLINEMPRIGYTLLKRTKMLGVGKTTYDNLFKADIMRRGIRVSVYCKTELHDKIVKAETELRAAYDNEGQDEYICSSSLTRSKGATVSYMCLPGVGRFAFVCAHLRFTSSNLVDQKLYGNEMLRQTELNFCNAELNQILESFVYNRPQVPCYVILFGDLNYRVSADIDVEKYCELLNEKENLLPLYLKYDELREQMQRKNIYHFNEGINNSGPNFLPTYKLDNNRKWKTGKYGQRYPSWCDRILYTKIQEDGNELVCRSYDRFDCGLAMAQSDHAGVISVFEVRNKQTKEKPQKKQI
mgnify:CR=1 FL=1